MVIESNKVVTITYKLQESNKEGEIVQEVLEKEPFVFLFGTEQVLPGFESNLQGKTTGNDFSFEIKSDDSYGPIDEEAIVTLPINIFMVEGKLAEMVKIGEFLPMNDQEGNEMQGLVLEIGDETIKMDFNHPMAGLDLFFTGKVLDVREANPEELDHGHVHGPEGHHH
ncbi:MAG: FKBP-type peptidyl-prolyl cis-trans isomerase SlyD [Cyclobacteriaceae bacterium]|jgi:FKBP-type peptidyl-prolyl cis-trans isomerase SlyD